jgi:hypothetical protein
LEAYLNSPLEIHPYGNFNVPASDTYIIGSFPIEKFTRLDMNKEIKPNEINFFYGGEKNRLWKILSQVFKTTLSSKDLISRGIKRF